MAVEANTGIPREVLQLALDPALSPVQYNPGNGEKYVTPLGHNGGIMIMDESDIPETVSDRPPVPIYLAESRPDNAEEEGVLENIYALISSGDLHTAVGAGIIPIRQEFPLNFPFSRNLDVCMAGHPSDVWRITAGLVEKRGDGYIWHLPDISTNLYKERTKRGLKSSTYVKLSRDGTRLDSKVDTERFGAIEFDKAAEKAWKTDVSHTFYRNADICLPDVKGYGLMQLPQAGLNNDQYKAGFLITKRPQVLESDVLLGIENTIHSDPGMIKYWPYVKLLASLNYHVLRAVRIGHETEVEGQTGFAHNSLHPGQFGLIPGNLKPPGIPAAFLADMECAEWGERASVPMKILDATAHMVDFLEECYRLMIDKPDGLHRWKEIVAFSALGYANVTDVDEFAENAAMIDRGIDRYIKRGHKPITAATGVLEEVMQGVWGIKGVDLFRDFKPDREIPDENGVINSIDLTAIHATGKADHTPKPLPALAGRKRHKPKSRSI